MDQPRRPSLIIFDVNETLSDLAPLAGRFEEVGAPGHLADLWFASVLRDGFALTVAHSPAPFAEIASGVLRTLLSGVELDREVDRAVTHVMDGFSGLGVHPDVVPGVEALADAGLRMITLTNGSTQVAERLLSRAGVRDRFEALLSVEEAGPWKPAAGAYVRALERCAVAANEAMLVAVHPWDIDGARRCGLLAAWIDRGDRAYPPYGAEPTRTATSVVDLARQLAEV